MSVVPQLAAPGKDASRVWTCGFHLAGGTGRALLLGVLLLACSESALAQQGGRMTGAPSQSTPGAPRGGNARTPFVDPRPIAARPPSQTTPAVAESPAPISDAGVEPAGFAPFNEPDLVDPSQAIPAIPARAPTDAVDAGAGSTRELSGRPLPARDGAAAPRGAATTKGMHGSLWISAGVFLTLLLAGGASVTWLRSAGPSRWRPLPSAAIDWLGRRPLEPRVSLHLIRCGSRILLLSVGPEGARTLAEYTDPVEVDLLAGACRRDADGGQFAAAFQKFFPTSTPVTPAPARVASDFAGPSGSQRGTDAFASAHATSSLPSYGRTALAGSRGLAEADASQLSAGERRAAELRAAVAERLQREPRNE